MLDLAGGALDTDLSVINNHMNEVMKTLTIITTLFMPLTFVTGYFGINFFKPQGMMKAWTSPQAFFIMLGITITLPTGMYRWMRRRTWV
jgi:magnesium transporter